MSGRRHCCAARSSWRCLPKPLASGCRAYAPAPPAAHSHQESTCCGTSCSRQWYHHHRSRLGQAGNREGCSGPRTQREHIRRTNSARMHHQCMRNASAGDRLRQHAAGLRLWYHQGQPLGPQPGCGHGASNTCQNEELRWVPASMACAPNKLAQASKAVSLSCTSAHSLSARMHGCRHMQWSGSTT